MSDVFPLLQRNTLQAAQIGRSHQSPLVGRTEELEVLRRTMDATEHDDGTQQVDEEWVVREVDAKDPAIHRHLRRILGTLQRALTLHGLRAEDAARERLAQAYVYWQLGDLKAAEEIAKETMLERVKRILSKDVHTFPDKER